MAAKDIHGEGEMGKRASLCFTPGVFSLPKKAARRYQCVLVKQTGKWEMDRMNVLRFLPTKCRENPPNEPPWQAGRRAGWDGIHGLHQMRLFESESLPLSLPWS